MMDIKKIIREVICEIEQKKLTIDYFKQRMPFLKKNWHEVDYDKGVQIFTDQVNHSNVNVVNSDNEIITFKKFKTGVNFEYSIGKVSGNYNILHTFSLEPIIMFEVNSNDKLFKKVLKHAMLMKLNKIGFNDSIELPNGAEIPDSEFDRIVNNMNKTFFIFEEFISNFGIELNI